MKCVGTNGVPRRNGTKNARGFGIVSLALAVAILAGLTSAAQPSLSKVSFKEFAMDRGKVIPFLCGDGCRAEIKSKPKSSLNPGAFGYGGRDRASWIDISSEGNNGSRCGVIWKDFPPSDRDNYIVNPNKPIMIQLIKPASGLELPSDATVRFTLMPHPSTKKLIHIDVPFNKFKIDEISDGGSNHAVAAILPAKEVFSPKPADGLFNLRQIALILNGKSKLTVGALEFAVDQPRQDCSPNRLDVSTPTCRKLELGD